MRDSTRTAGEYTLTVRKAGTNKLIRIIFSNGMYGFSEPTTYANVADLVQFYSRNPLTKYNPRLDTNLSNPVSRFEKVSRVSEVSEKVGCVSEKVSRVSEVSEKVGCVSEKVSRVSEKVSQRLVVLVKRLDVLVRLVVLARRLVVLARRLVVLALSDWFTHAHIPSLTLIHRLKWMMMTRRLRAVQRYRRRIPTLSWITSGRPQSCLTTRTQSTCPWRGNTRAARRL